jgi:VIT1/CCC1 family predicted Fe2+/Mn2+ transporter
MYKEIIKILCKMQKNEITEFNIYNKIASTLKDNDPNKKILTRIAEDEKNHNSKIYELTKLKIKPNKLKIYFYYFISKILGLSFGLKLMEKGESLASVAYEKLSDKAKILKNLSIDEQRHEKELLNILSEERLEYAGSIVLGLNDALVELTGALAGLTFALQNNRLVALAGLITGFAASLSMAASGYLSSKEEAEKETKNPFKAALYTGAAYIITVITLIFPYFVFSNSFLSLSITLIIAILIIFLYTFYITTAKDLKFFPRFFEMVIISLGIALISFFAGLGLKKFLGIDV